MSTLVQELIVGVIVIVAAAFVVLKVMRAIRPPAGETACPSCASGSDACATSVAPTRK